MTNLSPVSCFLAIEIEYDKSRRILLIHQQRAVWKLPLRILPRQPSKNLQPSQSKTSATIWHPPDPLQTSNRRKRNNRQPRKTISPLRWRIENKKVPPSVRLRYCSMFRVPPSPIALEVGCHVRKAMYTSRGLPQLWRRHYRTGASSWMTGVFRHGWIFYWQWPKH